MKHWALLVLALGLGAPVSTTAQEQRQPSIQQQFDAAMAARQAGNWPEALRLYAALETRTRNVRTLALARVGRGLALVELGRGSEAAEPLRLGLATLPANDETLDSDRFLSTLALGRIAEAELDYLEALIRYRSALAIAVTEAEKLLVYRGLIQVLSFSDANEALRTADAALSLATGAAPGNQTLQAQFRTLKGRALLNLGRFGEARTELEQAMRQLGGLTLRADLSDLVARSDLALAALLSGDETRARRYLAYTGEGRFTRGHLRPLGARLPDCGGELRPDDVAVVQFALNADGGVAHAMPVYSSRPGASALLLARAVRGWSFDREGADRVPAILRTAARIEVRCESPEPLGASGMEFRPDWLSAYRALLSRTTTELRAELSRREADGATPGNMLPLLVALAERAAVPAEQRVALYRRALAIAAAENAPGVIIARMVRGLDAAERRQAESDDGPDFAGLLARPEVRASPEAAAALRLEQAERLYQRGRFDQATEIVVALTSESFAGATGILRTRILELLVAIRSARGDLAAARDAYRLIGPGAARCGMAPRMRDATWNSRDYPLDALRWGFEGWVGNEISIEPDGDVSGVRTVMAYPPFVFSESARRIGNRNRYEANYVPDGQPCPTGWQRVTFAFPE